MEVVCCIKFLEEIFFDFIFVGESIKIEMFCLIKDLWRKMLIDLL